MYEYNCRASKFQRMSSEYAAGSRFVKKTISTHQTQHTTANPIVSTAASLRSQGNIYNYTYKYKYTFDKSILKL